jgi:hypothetical protein
MFVVEFRVSLRWVRACGGFTSIAYAREWATHRSGGGRLERTEGVMWRVTADELAEEMGVRS